ncbi:MAG: protein arginine kinase [Verrucomicrobiota bacterium]
MMKFSTLMRKPADWMQGQGGDSSIVLSSRIRLARNINEYAFPGWAAKDDRVHVLHDLKSTLEALPEMKDAFSADLQNLTSIEKQVLVERHLISREHAAKSNGSAAIVNRKQSLSIMVNEEDHLRMQAIRPGLRLREAYELLDKVDTDLETEVVYAFDNTLGYLTACPTNLGTGLRASVMLHLPALVLSEQINQVIQAVNKIGFAVRGLYGEGTEALANLFQVSNQTTLGDKELEIVARLEKIVQQIIQHEENARAKLGEEKRTTLNDQIGRAFAILKYSHIISSKEALNLLSMIRLGCDLGYFPPENGGLANLLLMEIQPAHLQIEAKRKLSAEERDALRAEITRRKLRNLPEPGHPAASGDGDGGDHDPINWNDE